MIEQELFTPLLKRYPNITHIEGISHRYVKFNYRANCSNSNRNEIDKTILMKALEFTFTLKFDSKECAFIFYIDNYNYSTKNHRLRGVIFHGSSINHAVRYLLEHLGLIDDNEKEILIDVYKGI